MKIGLTINNYYSSYLEEIAKLNNLSVTSICRVIVENFLSFNKKNNRYPIIRQEYTIVFGEKVTPGCNTTIPEDQQIVDTELEERIKIAKTPWLDPED